MLSASGRPLAGARVDIRTSLTDTMWRASASADSLGRFRIDSLPPGSRVLSVRMIGYLWQIRALELYPGETLDLCLALYPKRASREPLP